MPPRTRNARDNGETPALEDPARMPVAALQEELQKLGYEYRKDSDGNRLKKLDLVARSVGTRNPCWWRERGWRR